MDKVQSHESPVGAIWPCESVDESERDMQPEMLVIIGHLHW